MANKEKKTVFNILTNLTDGWKDCYDDYLEWCDMNGIEPSEKDSGDFWDWVYDEINLTIECDLDNMKYAKIKDKTFVITGQIGLWNGTPTIRPKFVRGLVDTILLLSGEGDRHFNIELDTVQGIITARQWSHDDPMGNTMLEARMLNKNGEKWLAAAEERYEEDEIELKRQWWSKITDIGMIY